MLICRRPKGWWGRPLFEGALRYQIHDKTGKPIYRVLVDVCVAPVYTSEYEEFHKQQLRSYHDLEAAAYDARLMNYKKKLMRIMHVKYGYLCTGMKKSFDWHHKCFKINVFLGQAMVLDKMNVDMYIRRVGWKAFLRIKLRLFMCLLIWRKDAMKRLGAPGCQWYHEAVLEACEDGFVTM